jgi:hypothetical protein
MQTHQSSREAFRQRAVVGNAFEIALTEHYEAIGAKVLCPVLNNHDQAIPGDPGFLISRPGRHGLDREFAYLPDVTPKERKHHTPAFMLEDGPIIAPDLRIEHRGKVSFVEAKVRPHASLALLDNAYHRTPVIGWRSQYTASYKRIAKLKVNIRLELLLYFCTPGRAQWRPKYASPKWGVFRFSKSVLANGWNRSPFESTAADFLRLSAGTRLDQYSMDITRRAVNEMHLAGINPYEGRLGSDRFAA